MANPTNPAALDAAVDAPEVRRITTADLTDALRLGLADFRAMPSHLIMLALAYPILGLIASRWAFGNALLPLLFPLVAGFALVGPLAAVGLYEISRRREAGLQTAWSDVFRVLDAPSIKALALLGVVILGIFVAWLFTAMAIYQWAFGDQQPATLGAFWRDITTTAHGLKLFLAGNIVGFGFALVTLMVSVVSLPMTLDRHVDAMTAVTTSVRAALANPVPMALWGLIVAGGLLLGALPFLTGLAVVVPVLGHATWHLYRKLVG